MHTLYPSLTVVVIAYSAFHSPIAQAYQGVVQAQSLSHETLLLPTLLTHYHLDDNRLCRVHTPHGRGQFNRRHTSDLAAKAGTLCGGLLPLQMDFMKQSYHRCCNVVFTTRAQHQLYYNKRTSAILRVEVDACCFSSFNRLKN